MDEFKEILKEKVLKVIDDAGFKAYFVGGCVRDELCGIKPHDYDICASATPEQLRKIFKKFSNVSENSEKFGVTMPLILIPLEIFEPGNPASQYFEIEIATLRKDISKGRHPKIEYTSSIKEDAERRDFTVNALYEDADGNIYDPTGLGKSDIKSKYLRFVGVAEERLLEDPLRAWRYVRFLSTKDLKSSLNLTQFKIICENLNYSEVSKERQMNEFTKILSGKNFKKNHIYAFTKVAKIFDVLGFEKEFDKMKNIQQSYKWHAEGSKYQYEDNGELVTVDASICLEERIKDGSFRGFVKHGTVMDHTLFVVDKLLDQIWQEENGEMTSKYSENTRFILMLAAFLHDIGKCYSNLGIKHSEFEINGIKIVEDVPKVSDHDVIGAQIAYDFCKNLKLSNKYCDIIKYLVENHMKAHKLLDSKSLYKIWNFVREPYFYLLVELARADENGHIETQKNEWISIDEALESIIPSSDKWGRIKVKELMKHKMPSPKLTGDYLILKGYKPGPLFKKKLEKAYEFQPLSAMTLALKTIFHKAQLNDPYTGGLSS